MSNLMPPLGVFQPTPKGGGGERPVRCRSTSHCARFQSTPRIESDALGVSLRHALIVVSIHTPV